MHLLRVRVPDFRVLKDVDISFEKEFIPTVFPLGSQNGGGKSTLLQLIFVLLHCSTEPERLPYLKNFLSGFEMPNGVDKRVLAIIDIWDGEKSVELEFFSFIDQENTFATAIENLEIEKRKHSQCLKQMDRIRFLWNHLNTNPLNSIAPIASKLSEQSIKSKEEIISIFSKYNISLSPDEVIPRSFDLVSIIDKNATLNLDKCQRHVDELIRAMNSRGFEYIVNLLPKNDSHNNAHLLCYIKNLDMDKAREFLGDLSKKVFLAVPPTQVFLFLSQQDRKSLFTEQNGTYHNSLMEANSNLQGLFTYDFLAVDILIDSFKVVRDKDFKEAIETGEYGSNYKTLLNDLNTLMTNKYVNLTSDFTGITFKLDKPNGDIEIYPEDLSHGELKRLSIYMWLKHLNIKDAIVLMDEVDIALHPDWQFRIVDDLTEWAPSNQYILATHSHELCQALTPSHVKVLEPKLTERRSTQL